MFHDYKKHLQTLIQYVGAQGFKVNLDFEDISNIIWDDLNRPDSINIESGHTDEEMVYIMLHEIGHNELRKSWKRYQKTFPIVSHAESVPEKKYRRRIGYYVSCLEEEFVAWNKGLVIAKKLDIPIREDEWVKLKNKCLMGYIRYFGKK